MAEKAPDKSQTPVSKPATANGNGQATAKEAAPATDAIALLSGDHRQVEKMFEQHTTAKGSQREELVMQICRALTIHAILEEEIFYPACREAVSEEDLLDEAQVEHDSAKFLIDDLMNGRPDDHWRDAKVKLLSEQIKHHVSEEEKPKSGIFAAARAAGLDLEELGQRLAARKTELEGSKRLPSTAPVSISFNRAGKAQNMESSMASNQMRERDERGRFTDDGGRGGSRGRDDRDDERSSRGSSNRDRDDQGRFTSSGRGRGGSDRDDEDRGGRGGSRGRGQGGWFGDSEGHSEAARRGWDDRDDGRSSRSRGYDDDDRARSRSSSRYDDDDDRGGRSGGRGRGQGGWFGDSEGHSEAARRGWDDRGSSSRSSRGRDDDDRGRSSRGRDDDDGRGHGRGGWFGDSEGHSEAARRGWDDRGSSSRSSRGRDDDDRGRSSRSRDDDDDRGGRSGGRGRGQGGWFGDYEGHSEAARRGWESRH